ncbi:MAG: hypothetical protein ACR2PO_06845 [Methyloligellaceae bacterium]
MPDDEHPAKKGNKRRDWLIIIGLVIVVGLILYFGSMDPAERYKLIGF